ncbi:MAG: peptide chain release factor 2 [Candidatus Dojkabacteria bacterium]|nr:MAG: peptide chain release factor 2 [Candidatus Dojkabacteria bacterium]
MEMISKVDIERLISEVAETVDDLKIEEKKGKLGELETKAMAPDFWSTPETAKKVLSEIDSIKSELTTADEIQKSASSLLELFNISSDAELEAISLEFNEIEEKFRRFQTFKFLSGKYDNSDAILSIHSGQGGTEANDWADMLMRMYQRYAERSGWSCQIEHVVRGTETGISTVTMLISGQFAFGKLKRETGTHRLVRLSPFNSQNLRQTSFAGVEVTPVIEDNDEIKINENDLEIKAVKSGGPGGQHVNKTSSAIQLRHIPTGITVHNSEQRSQAQNREAAMRILRAKLWQLEEEKKEKELRQIKGDHKIAGWGNQIRNYVLHPYKLVKDLRTGVERNDPENVLDGDLDQFVEAEIRIM